LTSSDLVTVTYRYIEDWSVLVPQIIVACFAVYFLLDLFTAVRASVPP